MRGVHVEAGDSRVPFQSSCAQAPVFSQNSQLPRCWGKWCVWVGVRARVCVGVPVPSNDRTTCCFCDRISLCRLRTWQASQLLSCRCILPWPRVCIHPLMIRVLFCFYEVWWRLWILLANLCGIFSHGRLCHTTFARRTQSTQTSEPQATKLTAIMRVIVLLSVLLLTCGVQCTVFDGRSYVTVSQNARIRVSSTNSVCTHKPARTTHLAPTRACRCSRTSIAGWTTLSLSSIFSPTTHDTLAVHNRSMGKTK